MKALFVVQRFGDEVVGGAELHAKQLIEKLASELKWDIEVWTTTARDYQTWSNYYPAGIKKYPYGKVRRFAVTRPRHLWLFNLMSRPLLALARKISRYGAFLVGRLFALWLEDRWFVLQGPVCPDLLYSLKHESAAFERIFFFTYLYYPTIYGLPLVKERAALIPTAHDEPPFYTQRVQRVFEDAPLILPSTGPEISLIQNTHDVPSKKIKRAGLGFSLPTDFRRRTNIKKPYLLYLGRVGEGKGVHQLVQDFLTFKQKFIYLPLKLCLAGRLDEDYEKVDHPDIQYTGYVDEARKWQLLSEAFAVVNPSHLESLSMVVLEALVGEVPVLANAACQVFAYYAKHCPTLFLYHHGIDFSAQLAALYAHYLDPGAVKREELARSRQWAEENYSWRAVLQVFRQLQR